MDDKKYIFISFSFEDKNLDLVVRIKIILENQDISVDYSEKKDRSNHTYETIWKHLEKRIKGSSGAIVILTKDLFEENKSNWDHCSNKNVTTVKLSNEIIKKNMFNVNPKTKPIKIVTIIIDVMFILFHLLVSLKDF